MDQKQIRFTPLPYTARVVKQQKMDMRSSSSSLSYHKNWQKAFSMPNNWMYSQSTPESGQRGELMLS